MCPGQKFAYAEAVVAVVIILREFKVKMVEGQVVTPTFGRVIHPTVKIWITLQRRLFWGINFSDTFNLLSKNISQCCKFW